VIHYDAVGSAERCFRALHDNRGLSVHFLLDLDGTIYQTLDLREKAFHARDANDWSVGVEIANIGGHSTPKLLQEWYGRDEEGDVRNLFPERARLGRQLRRDYVARPARQELIAGTIHRTKLVQYDYTKAQYESLMRLAAGLSAVFPRITLDAPRDRQGNVLTTALPERSRASFEGIVGHCHLDEKKYDPGPAFDWDVVLRGARLVSQ
jgi:N-acetylmuramoyl-L-alanine amidase